jgi:hypothetical protein
VSFFTNPKETEFLTKTIGCAPSSTGQKFHSNNKTKQRKNAGNASTAEKHSNSKVNRGKNQSSEGIRINTQGSSGNSQQMYKSF